jgi:hypothetical protein
LLGNLTAQLRGILVTTHGRDIEPLVRLHEVDRYARACRINHAETEAIFGVCWFGSSGRNFHACHSGSPFFVRCAPQSADPVAGTFRSSAVIFGIKFEWQFK